MATTKNREGFVVRLRVDKKHDHIIATCASHPLTVRARTTAQLINWLNVFHVNTENQDAIAELIEEAFLEAYTSGTGAAFLDGWKPLYGRYCYKSEEKLLGVRDWGRVEVRVITPEELTDDIVLMSKRIRDATRSMSKFQGLMAQRNGDENHA